MNPQKPILLILLCALAFLGCFLKIYAIFSSELRAIRPWYPAYISLSTILLMIGLFGIVQMKRWGYHLFVLFFVIHQAVQVAVGKWDIGSSLLFTAILLTAGLQYKKMI